MPEIAEVRIFADQLNKEFGGQSLQNIEVVGGRFLKEPIAKFNQLIFPMDNFKANTKGKFMYWTFDEDEVFFITLGMAASFGPQSKHSAIRFTFDKGQVDFVDIRHFGTFKISNHEGLTQKLKTLGWDPLREPAIPSDLEHKLREKHGHRTIAEALLDQKLFAGVGNYIRSEALYMTNLHPLRIIDGPNRISHYDLLDLFANISKIAHEAYRSGGATIATFKDMYGNTGKFYDNFKVYSKKQDSDGRAVKKITAPDGRSVFFVEEVQI